MKSRIIWKWSLGVCLTALPFAGGCLQGTAKSAMTNADPANVAATNLATDVEDAAALAAAATNAPAIDISEAEIRPVQDERPLVPEVRSSGPAGDLLRLANSGVDEQVILSYITNSANILNLSADEIIYLNDVGVSGAVITAALQRDQELKGQGVTVDPAYMAQEPAPPPQYYGGPTSNWVGGAQQPTPEQVAPQAVEPYQTEGQPPAPDGQVMTAPAPQVDVSYSTFYSSLSPYGTWLEVDGYGRVWQPTVVVVNREWRPYFDGGRWVYTDHGWYWASDYSWGWAPFHYGRWFNHHRVGWCWAPDYVWGPSWVTWRYNDAYCGWAPLPPSAYYRHGYGFTYYGSSVGFGFGFGLSASYYSFVHWDNFHHRHHRRHAVSRHHANDVYHKTRPVTRIVSNNNRVINEGISARRVSAATRTQVRPVSLRETRQPTALGGRAERLDPARRTLTVYKPETPKTERAGGIPMERVRSVTRSPEMAVRSTQGGSTGTDARNRTVDRMPPRVGTSTGSTGSPRAIRTVPSRTESPAARPERRDAIAGTSVTPGAGTQTETTSEAIQERERIRTAVKTRSSLAESGQTAPRRGEPLVLRGSQSGNSSPSTSTSIARENPPAGTGSAVRQVPRSNLTTPQTQTAGRTTTAPSVGSSDGRQQRSTWGQSVPRGSLNSAQPASPNRNFTAQPSPSASTRSFQTPSRAERQAVTPSSPTIRPSAPAIRPSAPAISPSQPTIRPSAPAMTPRQVAPSVSMPRQQSTPSVTAPVQRRLSAPQAPSRTFSAPAPVTRAPSAPAQRQFSAPQSATRSYSTPATPAPAQRQFSTPAPVQRQQSAPSFRSPSSSPQRQYSAPSSSSRTFSAPPASSSRGQSSSLSGRGRGR